MAPENSAEAAGIFPYKYTEYALDNGLRVVLIPMQGSGTISYYSVVRTGSRDEYEPGHSGFAHFFEHMMFRGTKTYPGNVYDSLITSLGADANAYTSDDITCFHLNIAAPDLEKVMELESDRFQHLSYEEPDFKTESQAVYGEYMKSKTSPFFYIWEKLKDVAFDVHTYKHTTMGFEKDIVDMPNMYEYSKTFFKKYYRPENVVLLITGDFDKDNVKNLVQKYYSGWQKGYQSPKIQKEPEQTKERTANVEYPGKALPILCVAYKGLAYDPNNKSVAAAMVFGELAFGENSDLYKKLMLYDQTIQSLETEISENRDPFLWMIWAEIKDANNIGKIQKDITGTIDTFGKKPVTQAKIDAVKKRIKYQFLMNLDTPEKVASHLARELSITGRIGTINEFFATLDKIQPQDLLDVVNKYFVPEKCTIVTLTGSK
jgi:zinc protease